MSEVRGGHPTEHWYALNTKPRKESQVEAWLRERGVECYLPAVQRRVRRRDRPDRMVYFPGYLFARLDFETLPRSAITWMPGVRSVVCTGDQPTVVADEIVQLIRCRLEGSYAPDLRPGDRVRITAGPLRDLEAVFGAPLSATERVRILLHVMGQMVSVEIDRADIKRV